MPRYLTTKRSWSPTWADAIVADGIEVTEKMVAKLVNAVVSAAVVVARAEVIAASTPPSTPSHPHAKVSLSLSLAVIGPLDHTG